MFYFLENLPNKAIFEVETLGCRRGDVLPFWQDLAR